MTAELFDWVLNQPLVIALLLIVIGTKFLGPLWYTRWERDEKVTELEADLAEEKAKNKALEEERDFFFHDDLQARGLAEEHLNLIKRRGRPPERRDW